MMVSLIQFHPDLLENMDDVEIAKRLVRLYLSMPSSLAEEADADEFGSYFQILMNYIGESSHKLTSQSLWRDGMKLSRRANKVEDKKGRFWEGRFHCQKLLDTSILQRLYTSS